MPGFADGRYNDGNRAFLQAFLAQSSLTLETARPILAAISTCEEGREVLAEDINVEDLNTYISEANRKLLPLDLEIRSTFHQHTRERVYALINTTSDPLTQLATTYTPDEIIYVKKLLDAMFDSRNNKGRREAMCVSGIEAIQTGRNQDNRRETQNGSTSQSSAGMLGPRDAESMLNRLLAEGWLEKSRAGFYGLSPRALMELKSWLVDTYNEDDDGEIRDKIKFCHACKEVITVGQRCAQRECACRLHNICTQNFFRMHRSRTCPLCNTEWDGEHYVGEKAITTSDSYRNGRRQTATRQRTPVEADEEQEDGT